MKTFNYKLIISIFLLLNSLSTYSQIQKKIDSLEVLIIKSNNKEKLNIFNNLSISYLELSTEKSLNYAKQQLALALELKDREAEVMAYYNIGKVYLKLGENVTAIKNFDKSYQITEKENINLLKGELLEDLAKSYDLNRDFDISTKYYNWAINFYIRNKNKAKEAEIYRKMGNQHLYLSNYNIAIEYYHKSLSICEQLKDKHGIARNFNNIGVVFFYWNNFKEAIRYFTKAEKMNRELFHYEDLSLVLNNLGEIYLRSKEYNKCIKYTEEALKIAKDSNFLYQESQAYKQLGDMYRGWENYKKALFYYSKCNTIFKKLNNSEGESGSFIDLAKTWLCLKNFEKVRESLNASLNISEKYKIVYLTAQSYRCYYQLYDSLNDINNSNKYMKLFIKAYDTLTISQDKKQNMANISNYESYKHLMKINQEKDASDFKIARNNIFLYISIVSIFVLILILLLLYRQLQLRKHLNTENTNKLNLENELNKIRQDRLMSALSLKERELAASTLNISQKSDVLKTIKDKLQKISSEVKENDFQIKIEDINLAIDDNIKLSNDWNNFKLHFEQIHPQFFKRLKDSYPILTNNDLKHCAYIKINLTYKQIAQLMNISLNGANSSRKRLKKKLNLTENDNLSSFIQNF